MEILTFSGLLSLWDQLPPRVMKTDMELKNKYYPIELDLNMTIEEKIPFMVEWYKEAENLWKGIKIDLDELFKLIAEKGPELRDGTIELCK